MQFVSEASATLKRRAEGTAQDVWLKSNLYPDYYLNTFHFQVRRSPSRHPITIPASQQAANSRALLLVAARQNCLSSW